LETADEGRAAHAKDTQAGDRGASTHFSARALTRAYAPKHTQLHTHTRTHMQARRRAHAHAHTPTQHTPTHAQVGPREVEECVRRIVDHAKGALPPSARGAFTLSCRCCRVGAPGRKSFGTHHRLTRCQQHAACCFDALCCPWSQPVGVQCSAAAGQEIDLATTLCAGVAGSDAG
jgi:hypothetical protein